MTLENTPHDSSLSPDLLIEFPPLPFVRDFMHYIGRQPVDRMTVLDIGCYTGRNTRYLASLGHMAIGISPIMEEIRAARTLSETQEEKSHYVVGDGTKLMFRTAFDVVLVNEILQDMTPHEARRILHNARDVTKPGGFNVVSGYASDKHLVSGRSCFNAMHLPVSYMAAGWEIVDWQTTNTAPSNFRDGQSVNAKGMLIARRPRA